MLKIAGALFCALLLTAGQIEAQDQHILPPEPPSAEEVFRRCILAVNQATERCVEANASVVHRCLPQLRELLAAGREDEAIQLARRCVAQIREQTENCNRHIRKLCGECVEVLLRLQAPRLAHRLREHCARSLATVNRSADRASNAITQLFQ